MCQCSVKVRNLLKKGNKKIIHVVFKNEILA